jgi:hypothetical protein
MAKGNIWKIVVAVSLVVMFVPFQVQAAELFAINSGEEKCISVKFGEDGGGDYTLTLDDPGLPDEPWVDNHYTSYIASRSNIVSVPLCFSTIGRSLGDEVILKGTLNTPTGEIDLEYGVCVASVESTDVITGSVSGSVKFAAPGQDVTYTLRLDSMVPVTLRISQSSGDFTLGASESSVDVDGEPEEVTISVTAPSQTGNYPFSLMVSAEGCDIDDCRREVTGMLRVEEPEDQPQAGFLVWLTPPTKSITRDKVVQFQVAVKNYGPGQEITLTVSVDDGLHTTFAPYSTFVEKGEGESLPATVRVTSEEGTSFDIRATAVGADGKSRSDTATLKVDEMVSDAELLDLDFDEDDAETVTLDDWKDLKADVPSPDDGPGDFEPSPTPSPDYTLYIIIVAVIAAVGITGFYIYRKSQSGESGPGWEDLGVK